jgi:transcription initiation factor IIE alpha subunit
MNDRQRLEAIVAVVCKYLPPDGISREEAMSQIISLVDPLPEKGWVGLTDEEIAQVVGSLLDEVYLADFRKVIAKLKERNT